MAMVLSLYMVTLTILLTFLVLSVGQKIADRRKKLKVEMNFEAEQQAQVEPVIAGKSMR
ncbi:hypothetical protein [Gracilibacillus halophilus]|uniref:hypothetical protein n=1 Tax=Gracilibacillus halophilus TaxID=470864 RepID=UPI0012E9A53B|nr:hypothetical protein [Gracilibacillus halophilus]